MTLADARCWVSDTRVGTRWRALKQGCDRCRLFSDEALTMSISAFDDRPPDSAKLTSYDERHLTTYLRLLDAWEDGADWREAVQVVFGLNPVCEPERARLVHDSHLARARWIMEAGHEHLLRPRLN